MKRLLPFLALIAIGFAAPVFAESGAKQITVEGKGACLKCVMKKADACQNAITVEKNGKTTTYVLADNPVSKDFHEKICKGSKSVKATGTCAKVGDHLELTVSKIELAE